MKTFVIHTRKGCKERKRHIDSHLPSLGINDFKYILNGDVSDIVGSIAIEYFSNKNMRENSWFYKHLLAMNEIVSKKLPYALIIEDDAFLKPNSKKKLQEIEGEIRSLKNYIINIEQTDHYVPLSIRRRGQVLYPSNNNKRSAGYIIDFKCADKVLRYMRGDHKASMPIDSFLSEMKDIIKYNIYWVEPSLVTQGSKNKFFKSVLSSRRVNSLGRFFLFFRDCYQRVVVTNLSKKRMLPFLDVKRY